MMYKNSESGRSMVEMLGVIAIIGVISVGGITSMSYVDSYFRTSSTLLEVDKMAQDIVSMCSWARSFSDCGLDADMLVREGIIDSATNRWGGTIAVAADGDTFTITFTNVPSSVCQQMKDETNPTEDGGARHLMKATCEGTTVTFSE